MATKKITLNELRSLVKQIIKESSDNYFETLYQTLNHVREIADNLGYELDENEVNFHFGSSGIGYETTKSANISLLKNGEPILDKRGNLANRYIHVSIYRMPSGRYELNAYKTF
jgi:hypothetical protein